MISGRTVYAKPTYFAIMYSPTISAGMPPARLTMIWIGGSVKRRDMVRPTPIFSVIPLIDLLDGRSRLRKCRAELAGKRIKERRAACAVQV